MTADSGDGRRRGTLRDLMPLGTYLILMGCVFTALGITQFDTAAWPEFANVAVEAKPLTDVDLVDARDDMSMRQLWSGAAIVVMLAFVFVALKSIGLILRAPALGMRVGLLLGAALIFVGYYLSLPSDLTQRVYGLLGPPRDDLKALNQLGRLLTGLTPAIIFLAAGGLSSVLARRHEASDVGILRRDLHDLRQLGFVSALGLVGGVVSTSLRMKLQIAPVAEASSTEAVEALARSGDALAHALTLTVGTIYTVTLLALFAPTALALHDRIRALARDRLPEGSPADLSAWLKAQGLGESAFSGITGLLSAAAPLITSLAFGGVEFF